MEKLLGVYYYLNHQCLKKVVLQVCKLLSIYSITSQTTEEYRRVV